MAHPVSSAHTDPESHTLAVGERGRVVIPADLRRELGIGPGSTLVAHVENGSRLVLEDRRAVVARLRGAWAADDGRSAVAELLDERKAEAALEDAEVSGDAPAIAKARDNLARVGERHLKDSTSQKQTR
jgi:AbrB family looped-hinge helix DNA binding protein